MRNALLDKTVVYLNQEKHRGCLRGYERVLRVGCEIAEDSTDVECARFCLKEGCDFLTADKTAYDHFLRAGGIGSVEIVRFMEREPSHDRPVYRVRINPGRAAGQCIKR